ncbi:hypothetical protein [Amycolatopsis suaedae]|uniref:hypothetical protein n=1 Tax=Amycolatopsis suaedae TaxID=2510978 RepID=UPI0013EF0675|nr:hypothetical protein [Amycolatopsis suaedae]
MTKPVSRRSALLAAPVVVAGGILAAQGTAAADDPVEILFTGHRKLDTFPAQPTAGTTFTVYLELTNPFGHLVGDGSIRATIIDVVGSGPPRVLVQSSLVFRFSAGDVHGSAMHTWLAPSGTVHTMAITGGTGAYRTSRGDGGFRQDSADQTAFWLALS